MARWWRLLLLAALAVFLVGVPAETATGQAVPQWLMGGHDVHDLRFQLNETALGTANVGGLVPRWVVTTGGYVSATPTVYNGAVYVPDWAGNLFSIDAGSGRRNWSHQISQYNGVARSLSRTSPAVYSDMVIVGDLRSIEAAAMGAHVIAVSQATGSLRWITQVDSHPWARITQSPIVYNGIVYVGVSSFEETVASSIPAYPCCTFRGSVVALNAATGALLWKTPTVPAGYSGGAVWSGTPAVDVRRRILYTTSGNNYSVPPAVAACIDASPSSTTCTASNDYLDSVLALDLATGTVKWSARFQPSDTHPGPFCAPQCPSLDFDFGSGPNLFTTTVNGTPRDLVGVGQKSGDYYALDRDTGAVVWSTRVGPGSPDGGIMWGTAYDGQRLYVADANGHNQPYPLVNGTTTTGGAWSALDPGTGRILWQTADPNQAIDWAPPSVADGVVYVGSMDPTGHVYALDAATGSILWRYATGGSVNCGPAIVNGFVYWGSGYPPSQRGTPNNLVYAFGLSH